MNIRDLFSPERVFIHPEYTTVEALLHSMAISLFDKDEIPDDTYSVSTERVGQDSSTPGAVFYFYCTRKGTPLKASLAILPEPVRWPEENHLVSLVFLFSQPGEKPGYPLEILSQLSRILIRGESAQKLLKAATVNEVFEVIGDESVLHLREGGNRRNSETSADEDNRRENRERRKNC